MQLILIDIFKIEILIITKNFDTIIQPSNFPTQLLKLNLKNNINNDKINISKKNINKMCIRVSSTISCVKVS